MQLGNKEVLWYEAPPKVHAALLRGTTADLDGNISFEKEALYLDSLNMVRAACLSACLLICLSYARMSNVQQAVSVTWTLHLLPYQTAPKAENRLHKYAFVCFASSVMQNKPNGHLSCHTDRPEA